METYEPKKLLILRILEILTEYSDVEHKLHQGEIISLLKIIYGIECERKAVARNIEFLQEAGYDIVSDKSGVYLAEKKFETGELRLLVDSVLANRNVCKSHTKSLIEKLVKEGGKYFKPYTRHVINLDDWQKADGQEFLLNIELLSEAIDGKKKISFMRQSYGADKKLHPQKSRVASPYQLILRNGYYYLAANLDWHDNLVYLRVDRMTDIVILEERARELSTVEGCENGLSLGKASNRLPYFYPDEPQRVEFETTNSSVPLLDDVFDWFGREVEITPLEGNRYRYSLIASPRAMRFWILQFGRYVKVLSPQSLLDMVRADIAEMNKIYEE